MRIGNQKAAGRNRQGRSTLVTWIGLAVIAAVVAVFLALRPYLLTTDDGTSHAGVGKRLESIELVPLTASAGPISLEEVTGRVVVINFWGTWCPPCVQEFPHLADIAERYHEREDFAFLSVSCPGDAGDDLERLKRETLNFLRHRKSTLGVYADPQRVTQEAAAEAGAFNYGYPTTLILDRQGIIRAAWNGYRSGLERQIDQQLSQLLDKPVAVSTAK